MKNLIRWFIDTVREMNHMMDVAHGKEPVKRAVRDLEPAVEIVGDELFIRDELPGVEQEDIDLALTRRGVVTISGLIRGHQESGVDRVSGLEDLESFNLDTFRHTVQIPAGYDESTLEAKFENGALKIKVRKGEKAEEARQLRIESPGAE